MADFFCECGLPIRPSDIAGISNRASRGAMAELEVLRAQLAEALAFAEKRGHEESCFALICEKCGWIDEVHESVMKGRPDAHEFQLGPCDCGYDKVMGGK